MASKTSSKSKPKNTKQTNQKQPIPQNASASIPYYRVYDNGIIETVQGLFSKTYELATVNFKLANIEKQKTIATEYGNFLSSLDPSITAEISMINKTIDMQEFQDGLLLEMQADNLNEYREEYNDIILEKMSAAKNNLETYRYLTLSVSALDIIEATNKFQNIDMIVMDGVTKITKTDTKPLSTTERLELLNTIYNQDATVPLFQKRMIKGHEVEAFSLENCAMQGISTKDVISPACIDFDTNSFKLDEVYGRSFFVVNYPTWIKGTILTDFADLPCNMITSVYFNTMPQEESIKMVRRQTTNINASIVEKQRRAGQRGISAELINPELEKDRIEAEDLLTDITKDNASLFTSTFLITVFASSEKELEDYTTQVKMIANKNMLTIKAANSQQEYAFNSSLPLGKNYIAVQQLMTTNTVSAIIPFDVSEVKDKGGMYYGLNASSKTMIIYNRKEEVNPNGCVLGMPGGGKSFACKREMDNALLGTQDEVYVIDPEREYKVIAEELGGSVIKIANGSKVYINPFDLNIKNADDDNDPIKMKTDFIITLMEIMIAGRFGLSPIKQSIIDRCVRTVYEPYLAYLEQTGKSFDQEKAPTLVDFYNVVSEEMHAEAQEMALSLERYVNGSLDVFAHKTNVDVNNRFTIYDIKEIGSGLKELGLQICLDHVWNKMISNFEEGKWTWFYIDEFYLIMQKESSANYLSQIWKRARKWKGIPTAITQNVEDMLKSEQGRTIINTSPFVMMLAQAPMNRAQLGGMFDMSPEEEKYIATTKPGMGILRVKDNLIPFDDNFPKDNKLYKIMTTKPDERGSAK